MISNARRVHVGKTFIGPPTVRLDQHRARHCETQAAQIVGLAKGLPCLRQPALRRCVIRHVGYTQPIEMPAVHRRFRQPAGPFDEGRPAPLRQHGLRAAQYEFARSAPVLGLQGKRYGLILTAGLHEDIRRLSFQRPLLFPRHALRETPVEEVSQKVMQVKDIAAVFRARDEQLPLVEPVEQLSRFARPYHHVRQFDADLGQQVELQQHILVGGGKREEEMTAEDIRQRVLPAEDRLVRVVRSDRRAVIREENQPDRPAARRLDVDRDGCVLRTQLDEIACFRGREFERRPIDDGHLALENEVAQFFLRQRSRGADASNRVRKLPKHHRKHPPKLGRVGVV